MPEAVVAGIALSKALEMGNRAELGRASKREDGPVPIGGNIVRDGAVQGPHGTRYLSEKPTNGTDEMLRPTSGTIPPAPNKGMLPPALS